MTRFLRACLPLLALAAHALGAQGTPPPGAEHAGTAFTFTKVADGVWHAVGTGAMATGANAGIIETDDGVVLVDSHVSPAAAWVLLQELRALTPQPVRTVINTHFHYDHAHGNQTYGPGVEIIGHEFTRERLASGASRRGAAYEGLVRVLREREDSLVRVLAQPRDSAQGASAAAALAGVRRYRAAAIDDVRPVPPTLTLRDEVRLYRGGTEIRVLFLGRGHTGGDVVVVLPRQRVAITGDLVNAGLPFLGDGYFTEWAATLERVQALPVDVFLPGHGAPIRDRAVFANLAAFLRDFDRQAGRLLARGLTVAQAEARLDLRAHVPHYPTLLADRRDPALRERLVIGLQRAQQRRAGAP